MKSTTKRILSRARTIRKGTKNNPGLRRAIAAGIRETPKRNRIAEHRQYEWLGKLRLGQR